MHLAAKFVGNDVRELLKKYGFRDPELTLILSLVAEQIIASYIEYNHLVAVNTYNALQEPPVIKIAHEPYSE